MLFMGFRFLDRRMFRFMLPGLVVGAPLGYVMLTVVPEARMKQLLGALYLLVTILSISRTSPFHRRQRWCNVCHT